ncbi:16S rRNA (cytosine(1402)-N(4))-methyltransferase [Psittacicella melopsittaci]|uniref:Ribosomal RNA small subunit methyltransferase H n=1 Tax=Psittacicella melopsittaci TaxID=2028576 RepID=A0A3A1Y6Y1_9GAMM|nr:16S rRNA (cytosine(1402)-N(4))-methyltransferase RsmH [Psittacicella melopsittaci]RIY32978.1 16S rRNA (cytosine(1402)-N(4))-methyltransferase [Psittacicella melopsittaci]
METPTKSTSNFVHKTVLLHEAVESLNIKPNGIYVDGTFGRGGHSSLILKHLNQDGRLYVFDRDLEAIKVAQKLQSEDPRVIPVHAPFSSMGEYFTELNLQGKIDGILLDLGVSSPQLDDASRGFSFMNDGPLDMRMDQTQGITARDWLYRSDVKLIADSLYLYGEEKNSRAIARAICKLREQTEFSKFLLTTNALVDLVKSVEKKAVTNKNPATRTFQAIRIVINNELLELETALNASLFLLAPEGIISIISFHSLEDRIVKHFFKENNTTKALPKFLPVADTEIEQEEVYFKQISKALKPSKDEIQENPRSRSSILRWAQRSSKAYKEVEQD